MFLLSTSVFDLNESPVFKRVPEGTKSTKSKLARVVARKAEQAGSERWAERLKSAFAKPPPALFALADFKVFSNFSCFSCTQIAHFAGYSAQECTSSSL